MTIDDSHSTDPQLGLLLEDLRRLSRRVDDLTVRLERVESGASAATAPAAPASASPTGAATAGLASSENSWAWVGHSRLLQRLAMISFVLVVALVLRTLSDSKVIPLAVGVWLGVGYAALLVAWGALLLHRQQRGQRVLPVCGGLLLCAVVVEASQSFKLLAPTTVTWFLLADLAALTWLGFRYDKGAMLAMTALFVGASALALGFPNPPFVHTALVLLAVAVVAQRAEHRLRQPWLPWLAFAMSVFFWLLWTMKARIGWLRPESLDAAQFADLQLPWFLPVLTVFAAAWFVMAAIDTRARPDDPGGFSMCSPTANLLAGYGAAYAITHASKGSIFVLGCVATGTALLHFAVAQRLWARQRHGAVGVTAFTLAGMTACVLAAPAMLGGFGAVAPVWAALALGMIALGSKWQSPGLRLCSYLLQVAVLVFAVVGDLYAVPVADGTFLLAALAATAVSTLSALHYRWSRVHLPPAETWFARLDRHNHASIALLWLAAANGFGLMHLLAWRGATWVGAEAPAALQCTQSVLVNFASIGLLLSGLRWRNRQLQLTAVLVAVYGGMRVFGSDLMSASGVPLVLSVFSFGVAAAVGSLVLGKLQGQRASTTS